MKQHAEAMLAGDALHQRHQHHVMVYGKVGLLKDGSQFKLVGGNLVVTGLARHAEFKGLNLQVTHESGNALWYGAEVVVVHLLVLGGVVSHQCAACQQQVGACGIKTFVNKEILLLPTKVARHFLHAGVEVMAYFCGCYVHGMEGSQQWCLVVERLTAVTNEYGRDAERVVDDEDRGCGVPCRIAAGFKCAADAARGE